MQDQLVFPPTVTKFLPPPSSWGSWLQFSCLEKLFKIPSLQEHFFFHVDVGSKSKFLIMYDLQNDDQAKMLLSILQHAQFSRFCLS